MKIKVRNMVSDKGNDIANQFIITTDKGRYFQSYNSVIAFIPFGNKPTQIDKNYWDYSKTTGKYRNMFLGEHKAETEQKIAEKIYKLTDLNK